MRRSILASIVGFSCLLMTALLTAQGPTPPGPPAFVTFPILTHVAEPGLDHGHFVFGGDAAIPSPLAPNLGSAEYSPALASTQALAVGTDRDVSNTDDAYEGETGATGLASLLVGFSNHIYPGNCSASAPSDTFGDCAPLSYASSDGGTTWNHAAVPRTWNGTNFGIAFDPGVDFDKSNTLFYSYGVAPLSNFYPNAVVMVKSTDGIHFTKLTPVTFNGGGKFDDKYYLAVDRSNTAFANRIYVSWDRNQGNNQILYIAYSADGGNSWSAPIKVNDGTSKFERVIGAYPAVNQSTGVVYDSWHDYAKNVIYVDKSTNGGTSWGTDVAAATTHAGFGKDIGCVGGRAQGPAHALKVGPSGTLYLVYADPVTSGRNSRKFDILFTRSTNGGATWSTPVTLNDDGGPSDQFHPTLSVESNGSGGDKVTVSFYDRRDDPANCEAHVYATQSTDNGVTWSANVRQTSEPSNFDGNPNGPGDYSSSTPFSSAVWPFFSDHRTSNPETALAGAFEIFTVNVQ